MSATAPLLEVSGLKKHFPVRGGFFGGVTGQVYAVDGVDFTIRKGETLSLVGESGCGKSTVGRALLRLIDPTAGEVKLDGQRIDNLRASELRPLYYRDQSACTLRSVLTSDCRNAAIAGTKCQDFRALRVTFATLAG